VKVFSSAAIRGSTWVALSVCLLGLFVPAAQAGTLAVIAGETLDIKADSLEVDMSRGSAILEGKVRASLGELQVECARVEVRYDEAPNVKWARGTGGVSARIKGIAATASSVEVDVARRSVRLEGSVKLTRGKGWVTADSATIDVATRKVVLNDVQGSIPVQTPAR